jgi:hypothetical protein
MENLKEERNVYELIFKVGLFLTSNSNNAENIASVEHIVINSVDATIVAEGKDENGSFSIKGKFSYNKPNLISAQKIYDNYALDLNLKLEDCKLHGQWKNTKDNHYDCKNYITILLDLKQNDFVIEGKQIKMFTDLNPSSDEYVGFFYNKDKPVFVDANIYDTNHIVYLYELFCDQKMYYTGLYKSDVVELKKANLI